MGFQQGLSGLNTASKNLDVIGNNVANASTVGFKVGQAQFADVFAASLTGAGSSPVGLGSKLAAIAQQFTQGNITSTNNPLDLAINGGGFFQVRDPSGAPYYSRNGQFQLDKSGYIVNNQGYRLSGYPADANGAIIPGAQTDIQINTADIPPVATGTSSGALGVQGNINLDGREEVVTTAFDPSNPLTYNQSTALNVYDSQGNASTLGIYFRKTASSLWELHTTVTPPGGTITDVTPSGNNAVAAASNTGTVAASAVTATAGASFSVTFPTPTTYTITNNSTGVTSAAAAYTSGAAIALGGGSTVTLTGVPVAGDTFVVSSSPVVAFDTAGQIVSGASFVQTISATTLGTGAADLSFDIDLTGSTQFGSKFSVNSLVQDGFASGKLTGFVISADGVLLGRYSNGQSQNLAQVVLAAFRNPQGLEPIGNNLWVESSASGPALIGSPQNGQFGAIQSSAVEDSNVDLTAELVNMITAQRVYQANAQTIKTQDAVLQTLVNLR